MRNLLSVILSAFDRNVETVPPGFEPGQVLHLDFRNRLPTICVALGLLYFALALIHLLYLGPRPLAILLSMVAMTVVGACSATVFLAKRISSSPPNIYVLGTILMGILYAAAGIHLLYTRDPIQTSNFALIVIGIGTVLWSLKWWSLNITLGWIIWLTTGPLRFPDITWGHYWFMMLFATILSFFVQFVFARHRIKLALVQHQLEERTEELEELQELRATLVAMEVHDFRNPLAVIVANLDLTKIELEQSGASKAVTNPVNAALSAAQDLSSMVSNLLTVSKIEHPSFLPTVGTNDILEIVQECESTSDVLRLSRSVEIKTAVASCQIRCDRELIRRVLLNLIGNAIKHSSDKSVVRITSHEEDNALEVAVIDEGPGIPKALQKMIFEKFAQVELRRRANEFSYGLGLAFCKLVVAQHGGDIGVDSDGRKGSRFWFRLPLD